MAGGSKLDYEYYGPGDGREARLMDLCSAWPFFAAGFVLGGAVIFAVLLLMGAQQSDDE